MFFYKSFSIPPNIELFLISVYTIWCLCSMEILSFPILKKKLQVCLMSIGTENLAIIALRHSLYAVHICQFILAYLMIAAQIVAIYPILLNKSPKSLTPLIITSTIRQIYLNLVLLLIKGFSCYCSGSRYEEFQSFVEKIMLSIFISYYIIYSFEGFRDYVTSKLSSINTNSTAHEVDTEHHSTVAEHLDQGYDYSDKRNYFYKNVRVNPENIAETKSENHVEISTRRFSTVEQDMILPSDSNVMKIVKSDSGLLTYSMLTDHPVTDSKGKKEILKIHVVDKETKEPFISITVKTKNKF